jgi:hypothetical protein
MMFWSISMTESDDASSFEINAGALFVQAKVSGLGPAELADHFELGNVDDVIASSSPQAT